MIRFGLRLATAGGRGAIAGLALTATAVAIGTAILLFALSFAPAMAGRADRAAWHAGYIFSPDPAAGTLLLIVEDHTDGQLLTRIHVAPAEQGPVPLPPGVAAMPAPGTAYVSPALAERMTSVPANELADRIGRVVGTIDDGALASPDELVAVIGTEPSILVHQGAAVVSGFVTEAPPLDLPPVGVLIIVIAAIGALAPVAVFVSTATRMSAARREQRLAALRLVGATPRQVAGLAVVEALLSTVVGAVAGVVLFIATRPLIALIPLDSTTWWPDTIVPPVPAAIALLLAVQAVGTVGALVAMRRLTITPLGVQRRSVPPPPRAGRVIPLVVSIVGLMGAIWLFRSGTLSEVSLVAAGLAFAAVVASIAFAGPWLTAIVGHGLHRAARGASVLLAARRLGDDPRGSFGAIAGVIMAVFVASAFFTFAGYLDSRAGRDTDPLLQPGAVVAELGAASATTPSGSSASAGLAERLTAVDGVTGAVAVRDVALVQGEGMVGVGWLASCADVAVVLGLTDATCAPGGITTSSGATAVGRFTLVPDPAAADGGISPRASIDAGTGGAPNLLMSEGELAGFLPGLLIDPSALDDPSVVARFPVSRIYVATDGSTGVGERVRTAIVAAAPASVVRLEEERVAASGQFAEIGRIVALGMIGTLALAGCSLAVAITTSTLDRRRQFVFLRSAGMPASGLRATLLLQAGAPLVAVAVASGFLGAVVGVAILWIAAGVVALPDMSLLGVLASSLAVAMSIVSLTLPPLERMTRPASLRHE